MTKKFLSIALAAVTSATMLAAPVAANATYESPLYPTPEGVELSPASYNEAAPDWTADG